MDMLVRRQRISSWPFESFKVWWVCLGLLPLGLETTLAKVGVVNKETF